MVLELFNFDTKIRERTPRGYGLQNTCSLPRYIPSCVLYLYKKAGLSLCIWTCRLGRRVFGVSMASSWPSGDDLMRGPRPRCPPAAPAPSGGSGASGPPGI